MPVEIKECYSVKPFFNPKASIERLLAGIPKEYISGLATVVLRDSDSLNHDRRRAKVFRLGKKVRIRECMGLYHEKQKGEPAWIEVFIDNVLPSNKNNPVVKLLMKLSIIQDVIISKALYHEIGHHIHKTRSPEYGEREQIADQWGKKLEASYFIHKYPYLIMPLLVILWPFLKIKKRFRHKKPA
jgi:hypothetical protein